MFKDELKAFHKLVSSSMGPRGHLKMVLSLAGENISLSKNKKFKIQKLFFVRYNDCHFKLGSSLRFHEVRIRNIQFIFINKIVISVWVSVWVSDHNSGTHGPI